jgi:curved DNA-binding protein CbpA
VTTADPYQTLGIPQNADDAAIRSRYLEQVREFPPERFPEKFALLKAAYDSIATLELRARRRLFPDRKGDSIDAILDAARDSGPPPRATLQQLFCSAYPQVLR